MTFILFLLFAIVIFGVMLVLSLVRGIGSFIFGRSSSTQDRSYSSYKKTYSDSSSSHNTSSYSGKKIFSKDEGVYVKYEEIKE
ncbi:DUF4834 family protein [Dysgonomonas sp. Marseille-P4677]|uniref:DUF4834 family protein n=1 Tax=Dysgonomonas sp. Marseille-P4677 TaxID=2364790 RepID=UPI001911FEE3|nr:DUF4834 family protein [Dysgonomonas sp. Marseille-P4677]MBK5719486.1 DUF4834 family protein [Dysgonomonas sp. Marseille-P4677]